MPENPSYNSTHPKWRGTELADLDCGYAIKSVHARGDIKVGSYTASTTQVLGVGECVSLVRVRAGTEIVGAELHWTAGTESVLAVGDPYCCGRILGPINTETPRGYFVTGANTGSCGVAWGSCGSLQKYGVTGDGCGIGYIYTCDTDIVLTNLYNDGNAYQNGGAGAYTIGLKSGAAVSSGSFRLVLHVREP